MAGRLKSRPTKPAPAGSLPFVRLTTDVEFDAAVIGVGCGSFLASLLEKIFAVINIAANVTVKSANCRHPFSIDALPISVRPAKQKRRCTQKTCSEDCPSRTRGLIAAVFVKRWERIS